MCTYNGDLYLQQQLDSLMNQTYTPHELVICDDGSSDESESIIRRAAETAPFPIRFFKNERTLGSTANFDKAIRICCGDLIALSDQDDIWRSDKIELQVAALRDCPSAGGVFSDGDLIGADSEPLHRSLWDSMEFTPSMRSSVKRGEALPVLVRQNFVTGATLMFREGLRRYFSPIPKEWVHDAWIAWIIVLRSRLCMISDRLISYRVHRGQQIGANFSRLHQRINRNKNEAIARHAQDLSRFTILAELLAGESDKTAARKLVEAKVNFLGARIHLLQQSRVHRLVAVLREGAGYTEFTWGMRSIIGDLLV